MVNEPRVVIKYLQDYDIAVTGTIDSIISNTEFLTNDANVIGKKGLQLSGGYYDESNNEDVGSLINGQYTVFDDEIMYQGIMGTELSVDNEEGYEPYTFKNDQYIVVSTTEPNTYIKSIFIYFDKTAGEIATELSFDVEPGVVYHNNRYVFMHSFGENSTLTSVRINILKWSKRNSVFKIVKVKTGYTATYDARALRDIYYTKDKMSSPDNLEFGATIQEATIEINDYDNMIKDLYNFDLIFSDVQVQIFIGGMLEGTYIITEKQTDNMIDYWTFDCVDYVGAKLKDTINALNIELDNNDNIIPMSLKAIIEYIIGGVVTIKYQDADLEQELTTTIIQVPYLDGGQTREEALNKCCQIGLLRMYSDEEGNLIISRGV